MRISGTNWSSESESTMRQEMFRRIDQDGDGKITKDEMVKGAPQRARDGAAPSVDDVFAKIDANQDGSIDEAEHNDFMSAMRANHRPPDAAGGTYTRDGETPGLTVPRFSQLA
jgi:Ca2+-binding EF-hand superfamily protein